MDLYVLLLTGVGLLGAWFLENPWAVIPVFFLPQFRIIQRAWVDFPQYNRKPWDYLILHESLVIVATLAIFALGK